MTDTPDDLVAQVLSLADVFSGRAYNADPWAISTEPTAELLRTVAKHIEALESRERVLREALTTIGHSLVCAPIDYADHNASELLRAGEIARAALAGDAP